MSFYFKETTYLFAVRPIEGDTKCELYMTAVVDREATGTYDIEIGVRERSRRRRKRQIDNGECLLGNVHVL